LKKEDNDYQNKSYTLRNNEVSQMSPEKSPSREEILYEAVRVPNLSSLR
jgi:hypothetical protein